MKKTWKIIFVIFGVLYFAASILLLFDDLRLEKIVAKAYTTPGCAEHFMVPVNK